MDAQSVEIQSHLLRFRHNVSIYVSLFGLQFKFNRVPFFLSEQKNYCKIAQEWAEDKQHRFCLSRTSLPLDHQDSRDRLSKGALSNRVGLDWSLYWKHYTFSPSRFPLLLENCQGAKTAA